MTRRRQILLVEDHEPDAKTLVRLLQRMASPPVLHLVSDGSEALLFLRKAAPYETAPAVDLVLLDLNLPKVSGYEVLAEVKSDESLKMLPIIILTGSELPDDIKRCYYSNANAYVIKPSSPDKALSLVRAIEEFWFIQGRTP